MKVYHVIYSNRTLKTISLQCLHTTEFTRNNRILLHLFHTTIYNQTNQKISDLVHFYMHVPEIIAHTHTCFIHTCTIQRMKKVLHQPARCNRKIVQNETITIYTSTHKPAS